MEEMQQAAEQVLLKTNDYGKCTSCGLCVDECPVKVIHKR